MTGGLIGRDRELSQLRRPVDPPPVASEVRALFLTPRKVASGRGRADPS